MKFKIKKKRLIILGKDKPRKSLNQLRKELDEENENLK